METLIGEVQGGITAAFTVFLRVGAAMALLPAFGGQSVPVRVRLAAAFAFTAICAPAVAPLLPTGSNPVGRLLATEVIAGLALGAILRLFVHALQIAGSIAAQSVSLSQILGGQAVDPQPAIGHVLTMGGLALACLAGLHVKIAAFLVGSYGVMPPGRFPAPSDLTAWGVGHVAQSFALAFSLAAPFATLSVLYNLALGLINRAMPQLMVAFVGAPAITLGGLVALAVIAPFALQVWLSAFDATLADPTGILP